LPFATHVVDQFALPAKPSWFSVDHVLQHLLVERPSQPTGSGSASPARMVQISSRPRVATAAGRFVSNSGRDFRGLNLLCYVLQVRRESVRDLGRITSRLRDAVAHLEDAREYR
jgi:hypothetical protein